MNEMLIKQSFAHLSIVFDIFNFEGHWLDSIELVIEIIFAGPRYGILAWRAIRQNRPMAPFTDMD